MHSTRIDLTAKARTRMTGVLNARLADALDLQLQAKQAHWNVKGPSCIALHELFDRIAGATAAHDHRGREGTCQDHPLAKFGKAVRKAIDEAAKAGDADTSDLFTGISRAADKNLWLVEAHLQADR